MKRLLLLALVGLMTIGASAQRFTDKLNRGLVAVKVSGGVYLSWRILGEEYYDVEYNVYRDGVKVNDVPLKVSNYTDKSGTTANKYTVAPVVRGTEGGQCAAIAPLSASYKEIKLKHEGIKSTLVPNDACCADVDGDGEVEILMKFDNQEEISNGFPRNGNGGEYSIFECLKLDGTRLWWVNCGPNMGDFQNNEQNIVGYDWDMDGKAEVVMRLEEGSVIHMADGTTYTFGADGKNGTSWTNYREPKTGGVEWFTHYGKEFLVYCNGQTGEPYQVMDFPLARLESGESDLNKAWGDGYGHRSSKYFFGAPYLDGRKPSLFLARGIYTRHKMIAYDVNPTTHKLTERWRWYNNTNGPWKGQGYHNYCIADVDMDGRDEIVFGSMVIDDNGKGLSTTGFGHGDAEHVGDLNPYHHGQEVFACMEDNPGTNFRDATTSKVFFRYTAPKDVGRCMAGNFSNAYPGGICTPTGGSPLSTVTGAVNSSFVEEGINQNFRIYWDGDLCEETFNYLNGKNTEGCIAKYGSWSPIYTCTGSMTNNDTKGTPCYQGDIFGDWREEIIMRTGANNIRIYTTTTATPWRNYTLWHDHQYRNAMVWQMCGYNQPPRPSYFLGELEGITIAPPPLMMRGREEVANGGTIGSSLDGKEVIVCETGNTAVTIAQGAQPEVLTFNVPTWVQGTAGSESTNANSQIKYTTYTCTVSGGGISGDGRLVKQGDGILTLPKADFTHTGETNVWGGTLNFDGRLKQSPLWLNRHTTLNTDGGEFLSIKADYGSVICLGAADKQGTMTVDTLSLGFGSRLAVDLYSDGVQADLVKAKVLKIERKTGAAWTHGGPEYLMPVIELTGHLPAGQTKMAPGKYVIAEADSIGGSADNLIVEGISTSKKKLYVEDGKLIVEVLDMRDPSVVTWSGATGSAWADSEDLNFTIGSQGESTSFVSGDDVVFDDSAEKKVVSITGEVYPASVTLDNTASYTFAGTGAIAGTAQFIKQNTGNVTMNGENSYTGGNHLKGGTVTVKKLSNQYSATGNLGGITKSADLFTFENGAELKTTAAVETGSPMKMVGDEGGVINNSGDFRASAALSGTVLKKKGSGSLYTNMASSLQRLVLIAGNIAIQNNSTAKTIELQGGTLYDDVQATGHAIYVPKGKSATWQLTGVYYTAYNNKVTGEGTLTIVPRNTVSRVRIIGNWADFEGTIKHTTKNIWLPLDMSSGMPKATLDIAEGCTVTNVAKTFTIGKLTGKGSLAHPTANFQNSSAVSGSNTWNVGNDDLGNFTFAGTFTDDGGSNKCHFNKVGSCTMTVSGKSKHSGTTTVSAGELKLSSGAQLGTGTLTVKNGARLLGTTTSSSPLTNSSVIIQNGGTLSVGSLATSTSGSMFFGNKNVTFNEGAVLELGIGRAATASVTGGTNLQNINRLTMNGIIRLRYAEDLALEVGDSVVLWKNVATFSGTPKLECPEGYTWDTSRISEGVIFVTAINTGINPQISNLNSQSSNLYDLRGRLVRRQTTATSTEGLPAGIYIRGGKKIVVR